VREAHEAGLVASASRGNNPRPQRPASVLTTSRGDRLAECRRVIGANLDGALFLVAVRGAGMNPLAGAASSHQLARREDRRADWPSTRVLRSRRARSGALTFSLAREPLSIGVDATPSLLAVREDTGRSPSR